ncbi:hypothetical protein KAR91_51630 [Candidatus Pacearchaeota archaeon]|nr:hypothetical protein [Candidatus Pacearchaeota archaeon]
MKERNKIIILSIFILINVLLAFYPHFSTPYPLVGDEYVHIAKAQLISEEHALPFSNPYTIQDKFHLNLESGFHFLLGLIFLISPFEAILFYKFLIIPFMILNSLLVFYLAKLWFKNYYIALFSVIFFGMIKSTGDFFAHAYFVPLTLGITSLLLLFIFFHKLATSRNKKNYTYLGLALIFSAITYPPALFFFLGTIFLYLLSMDHNLNKKFNISRKKFLKYLILISITLLIIFFLSLSLLNLTKYLIVDETWTPQSSNMSPILFFGIIPFIFSIIGLFTIMKQNRNKVLIYLFLFSIIEIYLFYIFKFTIIIPFRRLFLFYQIGLSFLAGMGSVYSIRYLNRKIKNKKSILIAFTIILLLIGTNYFLLLKDPLESPPILTKEKYDAIKFIEKTYPEKVIVAADSITSLTITPTSGDYVVGLINSNIGGGSITLADDMINGNCDEKLIAHKKQKEILERKKLNIEILILSNTKQNCSFLELKYNKTPFIYEFN